MLPHDEVAPLRSWRLRKLLPIDALAALAGASSRTVVDAEHGRHRIRLDTIRRLSDALGVRPEQVVEFRPWMGLVD